MKVETYEIEDVRHETEQQSAEAVALCEKLGLTGQLHKSEGSVVTRVPYRLLTDEENFVYRTLCPEVSSVETFSNEPIPLQVLKTLAFAKSLDVFKYFGVWSASSKTVKDPVLVAGDSSYSSKLYLLARWGEELLPLEVLMPDAIKKWYAARVDKLHEIKNKIDFELTRPIPMSCPSKVSDPYFSA